MGQDIGFSSGRLIKSVRTALEISQESLAAGLCSASTLGMYERGEKEPGKWVSDVFLERMGQIPRRFSSLYDGQELGEAIYRDLLLYLLQEGDEELFLAYWQEAWDELNRSTEKGGAIKSLSGAIFTICQIIGGVRGLSCFWRSGFWRSGFWWSGFWRSGFWWSGF